MRLGTPVSRVEWTGDRVVVAGVSAQAAVIAIPPVLAGRIDYAPALPALRDQLTQRTPMGAVIKCHAVYDEPFWRRDGLTGQAGSDAGPAKVIFDNSPPDGSPGVLLAFLEGAHARELGTWPAGQRRAAVLSTLSAPVRPARGAAAGLPRAGVGRRGVVARLLRRLPAARRVDGVRARPAPADRAAALGGRRVRGALERLYGWCGAVRRGGRGGGLWRMTYGEMIVMTTTETKSRRLADTEVFPIGLGGMPLALGRPDEAQAIRVIHAALDAGVTLIDTADAYCTGEDEVGHNERLIAKALKGRRDGVLVATKARPHPPRRRVGGRRPPRAHPRRLRGLAEGARHRPHRPLPVPPPRSRRPVRRVVGAFKELQDEGKVRWIGLSNCTVEQLEEALGIAEIVAVQNQLSLGYTSPLAKGEVDACTERGIAFLPWSPLGGIGKAGLQRARSTRCAPRPRRTTSPRSRSRSRGCSPRARP